MRRLQVLLLAILGCFLMACGGGGAFSAIRLSGRVLDVSTGAPPTAAASVQSESATASTQVADGSFIVGAPSGETQLIVTPPSTLTGYSAITFKFQPLTLPQNDVGDLWIGPQQVTVTGKVQNAADNSPITNAKVRFAGQFAITDATGTFSVQHVAYSSANTSSFEGITGQVDATNFLSNQFTPNGNLANAGVVDVGIVLMAPVDSTNPPPPPFNIWGIISPSSLASGTIVSLRDTSGTLVRRFTVGADARYQFWVSAGSYHIDFANGSHTAPTQNVTLNNSSDVIRADATLN